MTDAMTRSRAPFASPLVGRPAIVSAFLAPVVFIAGTVASGLMWPSYDPVRQTISELAAGDAPTRVFMTVIFLITALCHVVTGAFLRGIAPAGRVTLALAGVATAAVAVFPLPTVAGTSVEHRTSAMAGFILLAVWPVLGMRVRHTFPVIVRPFGAILSTVVLAALCFWFLGVWSSPETGTIGVVERVAADAESLWPAVVVTVLLAVGGRSGRRS
jgi:hypothetical membrane protein